MIDTAKIDEMTKGEYTRGSYTIDDESKTVSYKLGGSAVSISVIEGFVKLANHTGYNFQTKFNDKEIFVSPGMTDEQVKKDFFKENYKESPLDTYAIDDAANSFYTGGTYTIDDGSKTVSYKLHAGAVSTAVIEKLTELANHTGYNFQTKFNNNDLVAKPGMTEEQVRTAYLKNKEEKSKSNEQYLSDIRKKVAQPAQAAVQPEQTEKNEHTNTAPTNENKSNSVQSKFKNLVNHILKQAGYRKP